MRTGGKRVSRAVSRAPGLPVHGSVEGDTRCSGISARAPDRAGDHDSAGNGGPVAQVPV